MIPLKDNIKAQRTPFINYAIIGACSLVFLLQLGDPESVLVERYGMIPRRVSEPGEPVLVETVLHDFRGRPYLDRRAAEEPPFSAWWTLLTCIFLHGGWLHFLGNMWFLFIFGDNVEDHFGHVGYLAFYLVVGIAASAAHLLAGPASPIPTIGASGAIGGVMGAYLILYPRATVLTLVPLFVIVEIIVLPAPIFLGIWFVLQLFPATMAIGATTTGGVAWWAHVGGFVAGVLLVYVLRRSGLMPRHELDLLPRTGRISRYSRYGPWRR
ncbi:MAG: rhomboid family intramembrane serine protease [Planctomycetota bacterium]|nr:rhomboid family intramembrane serine protease [Planctomycetota bacterium]